MVVAEIINEINSTQPSGNYSQNTRATPIQRPQQQQQMQRMPMQQQQQQMQRVPLQQPQQQTQQAQQTQPQRRATPFRRPTSEPQQSENKPRHMQNPSSKKKSFLQKQKEKMTNKKVRFKKEVEERVIRENLSESDNDSESDSEDTTPIELVLKKEKNKKDSKKTKPKFLKKNDVQKNDLTETKGFYSRAIHFFTNDTKEPLLVLALVFAISMPVVNKLMTRFLPFLMKYGEGSMFVVGVKALVVALVFFAVKKLLL